jgi:hypothetical protein
MRASIWRLILTWLDLAVSTTARRWSRCGLDDPGLDDPGLARLADFDAELPEFDNLLAEWLLKSLDEDVSMESQTLTSTSPHTVTCLGMEADDSDLDGTRSL